MFSLFCVLQDIVKQVAECNKGCNDNKGTFATGTLNGAQKVFNPKTNDPANGVDAVTQENPQDKHRDEEQPVTSLLDSI